MKKTYPKAKISWLIEPNFANLVSHDPLLDNVLLFPKADLKKRLKKGSFLSFINLLFSFIRYLRKERFDLVLDLQGLFRTNIITFFCRSNLKYSLGTEFPGNLLVKNIIPRKHNSNRISSEYLFIAKCLKLTTDKFNPRFYITSPIVKSSVYLTDTTKEPFFVIFPFTTRRQKHWKPEFWAQLIKNLINKYKTKCIVLGSALNNEQKILEEHLISIGAVSLVDKTNLKDVPKLINRILALDDEIYEISKKFVEVNNFLYLGRGYQFPVALEGALKLKEISYIHAEGYPAAEMKHGPIALIDNNMPVVFIITKNRFNKVLSNIKRKVLTGNLFHTNSEIRKEKRFLRLK